MIAGSTILRDAAAAKASDRQRLLGLILLLRRP